jgi:hypothetical protein
VNLTVPVAQATNDEAVLPERVQEAMGELVGESLGSTAKVMCRWL